jgi:hypothetical protein
MGADQHSGYVMAFNFPSSPTEGQVYIPPNPTNGAPVYKYTAGEWARVTGTALPRNRLVNGSLIVSIQNGDADGTMSNQNSNITIADNVVGGINSGGAVRVQRVESATPRGSKYRGRITINTADTNMSGSEILWFGMIGNVLEGNRFSDFQYGTTSAKYSVLRFGFKAPQGLYSLTLRNNDNTRSFVMSFTITAAQSNTDTEWVFVIPGCTTGTWASDTTRYAHIYWSMANATTQGTKDTWVSANNMAYTGQVNGFATVGNVFEIFDVGWYLDPNITGQPPEFQSDNYEDNIKDIQRVYDKIQGSVGVATSATIAYRLAQPLPVPMRISPAAMSMFGTLKIWNPNQGHVNVTTFAAGPLVAEHVATQTLTASTATLTIGMAVPATIFTGYPDYNGAPCCVVDAR